MDFIRILKERGIDDKDISMIVDPLEFAKESSPLEFKNMDRAVDRIDEAIQKGESILVVADVDADGLTSGAIIYNTLSQILPPSSLDITVGYGKTHGLTQYDASFLNSYDLIVACDSGSNEYSSYSSLTPDLILLDHHYADHESESAIVVNPEMHPVERSQLSGAGVALKAAHLLSQKYKIDKIPYDLAAVGIIADMMDMRKEDNRAICAKGFDNLDNLGLRVVLNGHVFNSTSVRFSIAPLVNAAQRLKQNELALQLFLEGKTAKEYESIVEELKKCKEEQKVLTAEALEKADIKETSSFVIATIGNTEKTEGLSGLIANQIAKDRQKPTIFVQDKGDMWRGSIRSYGVSNLRSLINETGLAISEGHEEAAGISIAKSDLEHFLSVLEKELPENPEQIIYVDAEIGDLADLTLEDVQFIESINLVTGEHFEPITIMIANVVPDKIFAIGKKHTKMICGDVALLMWNTTKPVDDWPRNKWKAFDIIGEPTISRYNGKEEINIIISEIDYEVTNG